VGLLVQQGDEGLATADELRVGSRLPGSLVHLLQRIENTFAVQVESPVPMRQAKNALACLHDLAVPRGLSGPADLQSGLGVLLEQPGQ
jgi:hypothetical protein